MSSTPLKGYKENDDNKSAYKNLEYHKTIVYNDKIYVFWIDRSDAKSEKKEILYCESFDENLKKEKKLKKIYTANLSSVIKISKYSILAILKMMKKRLIIYRLQLTNHIIIMEN